MEMMNNSVIALYLDFFKPVNRFKEYDKADKAGQDKKCSHHTVSF